MDNSQPIQVTILLPAHNEQDAIAAVIDRVHSVMRDTLTSYEVIVVDDGSTDSTAGIAADHGVRVIRHPNNRGSGAARRTGIREARGEIVVMLDADGSYEPGTIPEMLSFFPQYDQVNGARTSEQGTLKPLRHTAKWIIRRLAVYLAGQPIPDLNTGLKAFKRSVMLDYLWVLPDGFSCVTTMTLAFLTNGHPVKYVPTPYYKRIGHSKFHPLTDTAKYFSTVVRIATYFKPMRVYGPLALLLLAGGIAKSAYDFFIHDKHTLEESDIILVCTAIIVGAIGLLADLIVAQRRR